MAKYSEGFKLMLVKEYLEGKLGYRLLAQKHNMKDHTRIMRWVKVYEIWGEKGLMKKKSKETYSVQFKLDVLSFIIGTGSSEVDTALHFGLNPSMVARRGRKLMWRVVPRPWIDRKDGHPCQVKLRTAEIKNLQKKKN